MSPDQYPEGIFHTPVISSSVHASVVPTTLSPHHTHSSLPRSSLRADARERLCWEGGDKTEQTASLRSKESETSLIVRILLK